jgi:hypothetical protein
MARRDAAVADRRRSAGLCRNKNPGGFRHRDIFHRQELPVAMITMIVAIVVVMAVVMTHTDADRTDMHADDGGIGGTGHQAKGNNGGKNRFHGFLSMVTGRKVVAAFFVP